MRAGCVVCSCWICGNQGVFGGVDKRSYVGHAGGVGWCVSSDNCYFCYTCVIFFFSSRRRHTRFDCDWSSDVCSSDLGARDLLCHARQMRRRLMLMSMIDLNPRLVGVLLRVELEIMLPGRGGARFPSRQIGRASCRERV